MTALARSVTLRGLCWEVPLAIASIIAQRIGRGAIVLLGRLAYRRSPERFSCWRPLIASELVRAEVFFRYLLTGPRWNTHALVAPAGPMKVNRALTICADELKASANYWSLAVYQFPSFKKMAHTSALTLAPGSREVHCELPPGDYYVAVRAYECKKKVRFPEIRIDGKAEVRALDLVYDGNGFYDDLHKRTRLLHRLIHFYVWVLLRLRGIVPERILEKEYLPVGDTNTQFSFGWIVRGERIEFDVAEGVFLTHRVYCTVYNIASLPVASFEVTNSKHRGPRAMQRGHFLVRVVGMREVEGPTEISFETKLTPPRVGVRRVGSTIEGASGV